MHRSTNPLARSARTLCLAAAAGLGLCANAGATGSPSPLASASSAANAAPTAPITAAPTPAATTIAVPNQAVANGVRAVAHRTISTRSAEAQRAYDRGLILLYAFDIGAARESFARVAREDSQCAMAYFGEALAEITDINVETDDTMLGRGRAAIARAGKAREATSDERALIAAVALRFAAKDAASQDPAKTSYENAMRAYAAAHPSDVDGLVETAFAIWQAETDIHSKGASAIEPLLDAALAVDPAQFGAHHLRVHFEEERGRPASALPDADFLASATYEPGESHLPHMAGHVYSRVGDYARVVSSNETAIHNDAVYFAHGDAAGVAYMRGYHDHDLDFVLYGLTTLGRDAEARSVAAGEDVYARASVAMRLHDWTGVLASGTTRPAELAIANARLGRAGAAREALASGSGKLSPMQKALVEGAIARASGDVAAAAAAYERAYHARPAGLGDPKNMWYAPVGEAYAAALVRARRYADAETVFSDELGRYPNDPRLLFGRAFARTGRGDDRGAALDRTSANAVWRGVKPPPLDDLG